MTYPLLPRRAAIVGAAVLLSLPPAFAASADRQELLHDNPAGSYLAARHAGTERDAAAAAAYYLDVLKDDPQNRRTARAAPFSRCWPTATSTKPANLPTGCSQADNTDRVARLVLGVRALKQKTIRAARQDFAQSVRGPVTDLTATLLSAWALAGAGDTRGRDRHAWTSCRVRIGTRSSRICMPA